MDLTHTPSNTTEESWSDNSDIVYSMLPAMEFGNSPIPVPVVSGVTDTATTSTAVTSAITSASTPVAASAAASSATSAAASVAVSEVTTAAIVMAAAVDGDEPLLSYSCNGDTSPENLSGTSMPGRNVYRRYTYTIKRRGTFLRTYNRNTPNRVNKNINSKNISSNNGDVSDSGSYSSSSITNNSCSSYSASGSDSNEPVTDRELWSDNSMDKNLSNCFLFDDLHMSDSDSGSGMDN